MIDCGDCICIYVFDDRYWVSEWVTETNDSCIHAWLDLFWCQTVWLIFTSTKVGDFITHRLMSRQSLVSLYIPWSKSMFCFSHNRHMKSLISFKFHTNRWENLDLCNLVLSLELNLIVFFFVFFSPRCTSTVATGLDLSAVHQLVRFVVGKSICFLLWTCATKPQQMGPVEFKPSYSRTHWRQQSRSHYTRLWTNLLFSVSSITTCTVIALLKFHGPSYFEPIFSVDHQE